MKSEGLLVLAPVTIPKAVMKSFGQVFRMINNLSILVSVID